VLIDGRRAIEPVGAQRQVHGFEDRRLARVVVAEQYGVLYEIERLLP
jgi:hypothetical protein